MDLLKRDESTPAAYPTDPAGLTNASLAWARVEAYTAFRWSERACIWIVTGPGAWRPDLEPFAITTVEKFVDGAWVEVTLDAEWNGGIYLEGDLTYRITGTAGADAGDVPAEVQEALTRLDGYLAADQTRGRGTSSYSVSISDAISEEVRRSPTWMAKALQNSGAADLLRKYRRAPGC